ncbi:hypothetical protein [Pseudomonas sp. NPDC089569]|uniref:hypothetical protein n=1 Tax=Pseudomonas sp. NPDC089569 TaxID=3390722 RepID=UPI003CFC66DE
MFAVLIIASGKCPPSAMASAIHALVKSRDTGRTGRILMQVAKDVRADNDEIYRYNFVKILPIRKLTIQFINMIIPIQKPVQE